VQGLSVRLGVDNLLDETYVSRGTYPDYPARGIDAVESPGRTVSLTATMSF
jgi:outer membrane receptor protein involved in Fe transport